LASRAVINAATSKEAVFESLRDSHEKRLTTAITNLEAEVVALASELKTSGGLLLTDQSNLDNAFRMRSDLVGLFEKEYGFFVTETINDFDEMALAVKEYLDKVGISAVFSESDISTITALKEGAFARLDVLGKTFQATLADEIYTSTISGRPFKDMVLAIKNSLVGIEDMAGRPMASHASQLAHDALVGMDRSISAKKALEAGVDNYLYFGSTVKDSRDFCVRHTGEIRPLSEWKDIGKGSWQGKASDDLLADAGGYNCGHTLVPVP
jgi:hypothetical protein